LVLCRVLGGVKAVRLFHPFCFWLATVASMGGLAGCKHAPPPPLLGSTAFRFIEPPARPAAAAGATLASSPPREVIAPAEPLLPLTPPIYPPAALAARSVGASVSVHVTVNAQGRVSAVTPSILGFTTPGPFATDFFAAVEQAVSQWKFVPAEIQLVELVTADGKLLVKKITSRGRTDAEFDVTFQFTPSGEVILPK
jgi:hypothetical protein